MIPKVSISSDEQELLVNFSPSETGKLCEVYTTIPYMIKYLEKMITDYPEDYKLIKEDQYSLTVSIPFKLVKPRKPKKMSDEQRSMLTERLASLRKGD